METIGRERPPKNGKFAYNGKMGVLLGTKLRTSRSPYWLLVQLAEYAVINQMADKPEFAWWIKKVLKKRDRIISKTVRKYWKKTHKYGLRIPHTVKECIEIDK